MRNIFSFIGFYLLGCIIYLIISLLFSKYVSPDFKNFRPWIILLVVTIVGYFLNFRSNTYNRQEKSKLPIIGYVLILVAFTIFTFYSKYSHWYYEKYKANAEQNESSLRNLDYHDEETVKNSFKKFQAHFASLNDFRLHGYYIETKDTLINGDTTPLHNVYFYYYLGHNFKDEYKALIVVINKMPVIIAINISSPEQSPFNNPNTFSYYNKEGLDRWNNLPETTRLKLIDTLHKYLR